jgi:hypothetical protein
MSSESVQPVTKVLSRYMMLAFTSKLNIVPSGKVAMVKGDGGAEP